jgi:amino acid transporter
MRGIRRDSLKPLRYLRLVLWSFFGIRRRANATEELSNLRPIAILVTAVVLASAFAGLLVGLATLAVEAFTQ